MPTEEFKKLLDREYSRTSVRPIAEISTPLLQELVNAGLALFKRCEGEAARTGKENEDVAALILFRHIIEIVDAIEVLVANSCGTAAIPLLRSAFEATLSLKYLLSDDGKYVERSLAWLVTNIHIGIKERQTLEPATDKGRAYAKVYEKEFGKATPPVSNAEIDAEIKERERLLQTPQFLPIEAEYQRARKAMNCDPNWFSLFGGPKNRARLAEGLGMGSLYQLLYRDWSTVAHGNDLDRYLSNESGRVAFDGVRRPDDLQFIAHLAAILLIQVYKGMVERFRKGENIASWYAREVKPLLEKLSELNITFTTLSE